MLCYPSEGQQANKNRQIHSHLQAGCKFQLVLPEYLWTVEFKHRQREHIQTENVLNKVVFTRQHPLLDNEISEMHL